MPGTTSNGTPAAAQRLGLLAAAPEHERVAALQPHDASRRSRPRSTSSALISSWVIVDRARAPCPTSIELGVGAARGRAARATPAGRRRRRRRARSSSAPRHGEQPGIAGPGADEVDGHATTSSRRAEPRRRAVEQIGRGRDADRDRHRSPSTRVRSTTWPSSDASSASTVIVVAVDATRARRTGGCSRRRARRGTRARRRPRACAPASSIAASARERVVVVGAALDRERALPDLRQHHRRRRAPRRLRSASPSRSSAACGDDDRVEASSARLRSRVAMLPRSSANVRSGASAASCARRRTEPVPTRAPVGSASSVEPDERVARVAPLGHRREHEAVGRVDGGQILGRVHREVGAAVEHRLLHLLHEHAGAPDRVDGRTSGRGRRCVATSTSSTSRAEQRADALGLPARQRAAARRDAQQRGVTRSAIGTRGRTARRARRRRARRAACRPRP